MEVQKRVGKKAAYFFLHLQIQFHANIKINNPKTNNNVIHHSLRNKLHLDLK